MLDSSGHTQPGIINDIMNDSNTRPIHWQPVGPTSQPRMPDWIRQSLASDQTYGATANHVKQHALHTVCEEARCPNRGECWSRGTATFMLLGDTCTRACGFCSVKTGRPGTVDIDEPRRIVAAILNMNLRYVVLTSVNRDELEDGGAEIFAETLRLLLAQQPAIGLEILTPDFRHCQENALSRIHAALGPITDGHTHLVWGHNIETVPRLYQSVRRGAKYQRSLQLLRAAAELPGVETKSAIMLGLGETRDEVMAVLEDLRNHGVSRACLGQYLRPSRQHLPVVDYVHPDEFSYFQEQAECMGFTWVQSGPMVRSSYHAEAHHLVTQQ